MQDIIHALPTIVIIQAYWLSFTFTGYVLLTELRYRLLRAPKPSGLSSGLTVLFQLPLTVQLLVGTAASFLLMGLISIPFYALKLPAIYFSLLYVILLLLTTGLMTFRYYRQLPSLLGKQSFLNRRFKYSRLTVVLIGIFLVVLLGDYALSLFIGSNIAEGSDAYVHLSRVLAILHQGFSLQDGFMSTVAESRYHFNMVHPLYVIPSQLFGLEPAVVWHWSLGFFRLLQWTAIASLSLVVLRQWIGMAREQAIRLSVLFCGVAMLLYAGYFFAADYPNQLCNVWIILLLIGLIMYDKSRALGSVLVMGSAALITLSHPTYAVITALFLGLIAVLRLLVARKAFLKSRQYKLLLPAFAILCIAPAITLLFPDRMTEGSFGFGEFGSMRFLGVEIFRPYVPHGMIDIMRYILWLSGYAYIFYKLRRNRSQLVLAVGVLSFFTLTATNPLFMVFAEGRLPLWFIERFNSLDVLRFITTPLGLWGLVEAGRGLCRRKSLVPRFAGWIIIPMIGLASMAIILSTGVKSYRTLNRVNRVSEHGYYDFLARTSQSFGGILKDNKVVVANLGDSYFLPAAVSVDVVGIQDSHATPVADSYDRLRCRQAIMERLDYQDLQSVHASYVVLARWDTDFMRLKQIAETVPYLQRKAANSDFIVYEVEQVDGLGGGPTEASCVNFQKVEQ